MEGMNYLEWGKGFNILKILRSILYSVHKKVFAQQWKRGWHRLIEVLHYWKAFKDFTKTYVSPSYYKGDTYSL